MSQMQAAAAAGSGDGAVNDGVSSSIKATVFDYASSNPLAVVLRDTSGDYVSVGGGTQYTEDAAAAANPTGTAVNLIRQDTPASLVTTDGDNVTQRGTTYGAGFVQVLTSSGSFVDTFGGGTQYTEDVVAAADPVGNALIMVRADSPTAVTTTDGDNIAARATNKGEMYVKHIDSIPVTDNSGSLTVDNAALSVVGGGVEATAMRVTIASDSTGVLSIDDNGGAITVDGTVAVSSSALPTGASTSANQTTIIGHLDGVEGLLTTIDADTGTLAGAVSGLEMQVDVITMPTVTVTATNLDIRDLTSVSDSVSAVQSGTWTEANSAAIAASASVLDDWDESDRAKVNIIAGQVGIAAGTGVDGATVPRVTLATNVGLPAGTANIGNVDIESIVGTVNSSNSSTATLLSGATFTGSALDALNCASICVSAISNVASAASGLSLQFSSDGTNWDITYPYTLSAGAGRTYKLGIEARYFRVVYTNGGTGQTYFRLQTICSPVATKHFGMPVDATVLANDNAQLVKSIIAGVTTGGGGGYVDVKVSPSGTVQVGGTIDAVTAITNALPAGTNAIGRVGHDITGIGHGVTTVTTAGTDVALAGSTACKRVVIQAQTDNTSGIAVGATGVDATVATGTGVYLNPGDAFEIEIDNLADVFIDSLVNGEGCRYTYFS